MKPLSRTESAVQNDQAIETRRVARSIVDREPELNLKSLDSLSVPAGISRSNENPNVPTEQSDYSRRLEVLTVWVLIAVLVVFSCGALYILWSKASRGW
jgi:hypothetical protein